MRRNQRAAHFRANRIPKFPGYFERILRRNNDGADFMFGKRVSYVDLSLFQMIEGSRYAFSRTMERLESQHPRLIWYTIESWLVRTSPPIYPPRGDCRSIS